jgi:hypothetical protein
MRRIVLMVVVVAGVAVGCTSRTVVVSAPTTTATPGTTVPASSAPVTTVEATTTTTTTTPATAAVDPCTLVTKAEAAKIVGVALNDPIKAGNPDDQLCQYTSPPTGPTAQVEAFSGAGAKKQLDIDKDTLKHDFTKLAGIGDEAWLESSNVFVRNGTNWASINVVALDADPKAVQAALKAQAAVIAGRLP